MVRDVTPPAKLEQSQAQALQHLNTLLACAAFGFAFFDRDLRFLRISDQLAEINGYSVAAHLGKTVAEIVPMLEATVREVTERILATGQPVLDHEFSGETARAPGITRYWNESWYPVHDECGAIVGFCAVVEDVTERKQTEAQLRLKNQRFELAVKTSQAVLWQQDLDLRFTWLHNPVPGIDGSDAVGKREADLLERAEDAAVIEGLKREVLRSGVAMRAEFFPQIQGVVHCFDLLMEPLRDAAGHITGLTGAALDITERKRIELNLIETTAAAEKANRAKSDFLSNMTHELRTPLNSILGFAQLIESGAQALSPVQRQNLEHIIKGGWYMLDLVNELLDLAQIDSGKLPLAQEPVSVEEVLNDCRALIEPQARERGIDMIFPSTALLGYACADRSRVKQVMLNLLSNAVKYNKSQGVVSVEVVLIAPDAIRVSIRDTGEGLAPEKLAQLFQSFNRLGREAGPQQGTGIGLVMSKHLVELMGGAIGAESTVGVGSVFWFELKWVSAQQAASQ